MNWVAHDEGFSPASPYYRPEPIMQKCDRCCAEFKEHQLRRSENLGEYFCDTCWTKEEQDFYASPDTDLGEIFK